MPMQKTSYVVRAAVLTLAVLLSACGGAVAAPTRSAPDKGTLQLQWSTQAQFPGYYAAPGHGLYRAANLDVTILEGGPNIGPEQVVASGGAQFGLDWMGSLLSSRDQSVNLVNIAQVFQRGAILELSWKNDNISGVDGLKGKTVG